MMPLLLAEVLFNANARLNHTNICRIRPWRVRRGHQGCPTRLEDRMYRKTGRARWYMFERRLHTLESYAQ